jgi:hypothetical protein
MPYYNIVHQLNVGWSIKLTRKIAVELLWEEGIFSSSNHLLTTKKHSGFGFRADFLKLLPRRGLHGGISRPGWGPPWGTDGDGCLGRGDWVLLLYKSQLVQILQYHLFLQQISSQLLALSHIWFRKSVDIVMCASMVVFDNLG